jgi:hypothetical protein
MADEHRAITAKLLTLASVTPGFASWQANASCTDDFLDPCPSAFGRPVEKNP